MSFSPSYIAVAVVVVVVFIGGDVGDVGDVVVVSDVVVDVRNVVVVVVVVAGDVVVVGASSVRRHISDKDGESRVCVGGLKCCIYG